MDNEARYQQTLDYLYSFVDYSLTRSSQYSAEAFDLGRMQAFMQQLGDPWQTYPIVHVAGTKGKGSVSALCASALQAAGYSVGLYTSPHLEDYAERIQVNRQPISHPELCALLDQLRPELDKRTGLTTFEITTALAFLYFAKQAVNAAVVEVGLGGRLDATNVVIPKVSVITALSLDHTQILGDTLEAIAGEKGGIIKPGIPVVLAPQVEETRQVIQRIAAERGAPLIEVGRDWLFERRSSSLGCGQVFEMRRSTGSGERVTLTIPLLGYHQVENAATAYVALQAARENGLGISEQAIRAGFAEVSWPARFEILRYEPPVVIDAAHNRDSAFRLRQALEEYFPGRPIVMVFGASEDKDVEGMLAELLPRACQMIATRSYHPRAMQPKLIIDLAGGYGKPAKIVEEVEQALAEALRIAGDEALVLVTGSVFVAAGARETWYRSSYEK